MKKFLFFLYILTCLLPSAVEAAEILDATPIDFSANQLKSVLVEEDQKIYPYQLGITNPGFYFLRLESGSEVKTVKIKIIY